jgi:hypothetical protein
LLDDEVLPLRVAQFSKVSPENIEMWASGTRAQTSSQPTRFIPAAFCALSAVGKTSGLTPSARIIVIPIRETKSRRFIVASLSPNEHRSGSNLISEAGG